MFLSSEEDCKIYHKKEIGLTNCYLFIGMRTCNPHIQLIRILIRVIYLSHALNSGWMIILLNIACSLALVFVLCTLNNSFDDITRSFPFHFYLRSVFHFKTGFWVEYFFHKIQSLWPSRPYWMIYNPRFIHYIILNWFWQSISHF